MKGINKLKDTVHFKYYEYSDGFSNESNLKIKSEECKSKSYYKDYKWFDVSVNYPVFYKTRKNIFKKCGGIF